MSTLLPCDALLDAETWLAAALGGESDVPARSEPHAGAVVATAPASVGHARAITRIREALADAAAPPPCEAVAESVAVRVCPGTAFAPDVLLYCGPRLDDDAAMVEDATFVVEVVSPASAAADMGRKLARYAGLPSLRGCHVVPPEEGRAILPMPGAAGALETRLFRADQPAPPATIDPPGFALDVPALLAR
jgi:Uma2 family endonuclease